MQIRCRHSRRRGSFCELKRESRTLKKLKNIDEVRSVVLPVAEPDGPGVGPGAGAPESGDGAGEVGAAAGGSRRSSGALLSEDIWDEDTF